MFHTTAIFRPIGAAAIALALCAWASATVWAGVGKFTISVVDADTQQPLPARLHLKNARGRPMRPRVKAPYWKDHIVFDGSVELKLNQGHYQFELECGPEYKTRSGHFEIRDLADDQQEIEMHRFVDLSAEGWWSGDLYVERKVRDIELLMRAEDLHVAPLITWGGKSKANRTRTAAHSSSSGPLVSFDSNRYYHIESGKDARSRGTLLYFHLDQPPGLQAATREYPSSTKFLQQILKQHDESDRIHVDVPRPSAWDLPLWLASGGIDSIGLANSMSLRGGAITIDTTARPFNQVLFPSPHGVGRWSEAIYYHVLECGLRIPPSAGSGSGVVANPVGYQRVYVYCGDDYSYEKWWENLRAGRVFVTSGPLLRAQVEGHPPGHVFTAKTGERLDLEIGLKLSTRDKIEYLEVVQNGRVVHEVRLDEWAKADGRLPPLVFGESGWFLVRAVTTNQETYRFASTGPYYVEFDGRPRVSRQSVGFFFDWLEAGMNRVALRDKQQKKEVLAEYRAARKFWEDLFKRTNTE